MIFEHPEYKDHEHVQFVCDINAGLMAIIAIHSTVAGPAMGGCRMRTYGSADDALTDALRLSSGMTKKNIMAGLPYGGAKAVIIGDPKAQKDPTLLRAFASRIQDFGGRFITGEDVGISVEDVEIMRSVTPHVRGIPQNGPGDPSPMTALGVFGGIRKAVELRLGKDDLVGVRVLVQGLGAVGNNLADLLHRAGAKLFVCDIDEKRVTDAATAYGAVAVSSCDWQDAEVDLYAPCALGATLEESSIARLRAKIVAGAANNQLSTPEDGMRLFNRGILYAPDYVINAGGVMSTALEGPNFDQSELLARVNSIASTLETVFSKSREENRPTSEIADRLAAQRLAEAQARQRSYQIDAREIMI